MMRVAPARNVRPAAPALAADEEAHQPVGRNATAAVNLPLLACSIALMRSKRRCPIGTTAQ
eukprot:CAMPEP_0185293660 /NCGR_PEP_ID=MMETSP1363-20130426/7032_1 /TAXON_ID=38817 /ORGANISM="Gephyrocapsa oceanica, Strain RCC1303" /LENGTH=60 /DNA_ID=CAMNT_0027890047 /DNA_START=28 /DNA_END=207 /DNA_ORIENTATION=-